MGLNLEVQSPVSFSSNNSCENSSRRNVLSKYTICGNY